MAELAFRAAPARCVILDDGVRLDLGCRRRSYPAGRAGRDRRRVDRVKRARDQPAAGAASLTPPPSTGSSPYRGRHEVPIVEGDRCTFLWRGEADAVHLVQRIVGLPDRIAMRRLWGTDLWYVVLELPAGSRINYQLKVRHGEHVETTNDPLNPKVSYSPVGTSSVCFAHGYHARLDHPDPDARPGELTELVVRSRALRPTPGSGSTCPRGSAVPRPTRCWSCTTAATSCSTPRRRRCWTT